MWSLESCFKTCCSHFTFKSQLDTLVFPERIMKACSFHTMWLYINTISHKKPVTPPITQPQTIQFLHLEKGDSPVFTVQTSGQKLKDSLLASTFSGLRYFQSSDQPCWVESTIAGLCEDDFVFVTEDFLFCIWVVSCFQSCNGHMQLWRLLLRKKVRQSCFKANSSVFER